MNYSGMEEMMKVQAVTDVGRERSVNQDYVYYSLTETGSLPNLFLVATEWEDIRRGTWHQDIQ